MRKNLYAIFFLLLAGTVISIFLFEPVLINPNSYLFSKDGDAVKSYYNFSYYLKYDEGIKHDGINYPYGDHLLYINSHPLYVNLLKIVDKSIISLSDYGPGILNLSMIFSLVLAIPFIFLILRKYSLPVWYSVIISLIILYLTPQFDRIHGHFEMVYAFFIPLFWYLLILFERSKKKLIWGIGLALAGLIGGFTSAYYAALFSIFLLAFLLLKLWKYRKELYMHRKEVIFLFVLSLVPIIAVKGLVSITDWVNDRPDNPWGFFRFHSNIWSIFLPNLSALKEVFNDPKFLRYQWEGKAYVGLPATILAIIIVFSLLYSMVSKNKLRLNSLFPNKELNYFLVSSFIILLFSMCFPFKYGLGFLKDWIPQLKQFRALGRFSWIFYYVFTVYTAYLVYVYYRLLRRKGFKIISLVLVLLVIGYWSLDAGMNIKISTRNLFNQNDLLESSSTKYNEMFQEAGIKPADYQAILFLPFANTCGDKLLFQNGMEAFNQAMSISYHTGIPLVQSFSPRLSFQHALSSIQMLADPAIRKTRFDDMNDQPLLVLQTHEELTRQEKWLRDQSRVLVRKEEYILSEIDPEIFIQSHREWQAKARKVIDSMDCIGQQICTNAPAGTVFYKNFETMKEYHVSFNGEGALYMKKGKQFLISREEFEKLKAGIYNLSFWIYVDHRVDNMPEPRIFQWDKEGNQVQVQRLNNREEHNVYNHWVRIDEKIEVKEDFDYAVEIKGEYVSVDDLLLQLEGSNVFVNNDEGISLFNNFPLEY